MRRYAATFAVLAVFVGGHAATARDDPPKVKVTDLAETGPIILTTKPTVLPLKPVAGESPKNTGPVRIVGETKLPPYKIVRLKAENVPEKFGLRWRVKATDPRNQELIDWATGDRVQKPEWVAPPGSYTVELTVGGTDKDGQFVLDGDEVVVTIGPPTPAPPPGPGPPPPGPGPPPPTPSVAPIAKPGLRVLIVRESNSNAMSALTSGQREVILPGAVRDYLMSKTVTETENPNGAWRILDPQINPLTNGDPDGKTWAAAMGRPRVPKADPITGVIPPPLPWVVISNGTKNIGHEGPLPADITGEKFVALLKQYE